MNLFKVAVPLLALFVAGCQNASMLRSLTPGEKAWLQQENHTLTVAAEANYPPFSFVNRDSSMAGIAEDYLALLSQKLEINVVYAPPANLEHQLALIKNGGADVVPNLKPTPERLEYLIFTQPYIQVPAVIITRKNSSRIAELKDLNHLRVAVGKNYGVHEYLAENFPSVALVPVADDLVGLRQVSFGELDAVVMDVASASYFIEREGIVNLRVAGEARYNYDLCLAVRTKSVMWQRILDKGLNSFSAKERAEIARRWIGLSTVSFWQRYRWHLLLILGGTVFITGWIFLWNLSLKRQVKRQTATVRNEMAERLRTEAHLKAILEGRHDAIWALDHQYKITLVNSYLKREFKVRFGFDLKKGMHAVDVLPESIASLWKSFYDKALAGETVSLEYNPDAGNPAKTFLVSMNPIRIEDSVAGVSVISMDITDRIEAAERIRQELKEKEVLLKEVHHRVKNNMNIMTSLLSLQAHHIHSPEDAVKALDESQKRIMAMAMVHDMLYRSDDLSEIEMKEYVRHLSSQLIHALAGSRKIRLELDIEKVALDINAAIPCGLILNECLTNALKHAFTDRETGVIEISLKRRDAQTLNLIFSDDGVGLPAAVPFPSESTLGLQLLSILTHQLEGQVTLHRDSGTRYEFVFPAGPKE